MIPFSEEDIELMVDLINLERNKFSQDNRYSNLLKVEWNQNLTSCLELSKNETCNIIEEQKIYDQKYLPINFRIEDIVKRWKVESLSNMKPGYLFLPRFSQVACSYINNTTTMMKCITVNLKVGAKTRGNNIAKGKLCSNCIFWDNSTCNAIVYENLCGISGPRGEKGEKGSVGNKGNIENEKNSTIISKTGEIGSKGYKGDKGDTTVNHFKLKGIQGLIGDKGIKGKQLINGLRGEKGDKGDQGIQGPTGPKGEKGPKGETGKIIPLKGKLYYEDSKFWLIYILLWIGLVKNTIIFIIRSRKKQGNYFLKQIEKENSYNKEEEIKESNDIENEQLETGIFGDSKLI